MDSFTFSRPWSARWALPVGLALSAPVAFAQEAPSAAVPILKYHSVFNQYQGFKEQPVSPWQGTNDAVEKIDGRRAHAMEARLPDADDGTAATPGKAKMHGEHAEHGRKR